MKQLQPVFGDIHPVEKFIDFLGLSLEDFDNNYPIQEVSTGVYFYIIPLKTKEALKRVKVDSDKLEEYSKDRNARWPLMFCPEPENPENQIKSRMITSFTEDPATGSANGCLAGYLLKHRYFDEKKIDIRVEQGAEINRPSILYLRAEENGERITIKVGGKVAFVLKGHLV
jgi:trans-2,3-dihydro-3-hydroxyanthranilate isomerase